MKITGATRIAILLLAAATFMPAARSQDKNADATDMAALRAAAAADKKALVASTLKLTPAEAAKFWPVYDTYQRGLDMNNRRRTVGIVGLVGMDKPASDLYAKSFANDQIAADEGEIKARRTLYNRLMRPIPSRIMPPKKAARYLQLEAKLRAAQAYDIATTIPLIK